MLIEERTKRNGEDDKHDRKYGFEDVCATQLVEVVPKGLVEPTELRVGRCQNRIYGNRKTTMN